MSNFSLANDLSRSHPLQMRAARRFLDDLFDDGFYNAGYLDRTLGLEQAAGESTLEAREMYRQGWLDADGDIELYLEDNAETNR